MNQNKTYAIVVANASAYGMLIAKQLFTSLQQQGLQVTLDIDHDAQADVKIVITDEMQADTETVIYLDKNTLNSSEFDNPAYLNTLLKTDQHDWHSPNTQHQTLTKPLSIVAVTACPTGVAHTFMSAEAIENYAKAQGWNVKVETRGQVGVGNAITEEEVANADLVFVAADIDVDLSKFYGKKMYRTSTGLALKKTKQEFTKAFEQAVIYEDGQQAGVASQTDEKKGVYKHLMTGVSHMLPLVVAGGLLIAMSFMFGVEAFKDSSIAMGLPKALMDIGGGSAFALMIAVFSGYVAYSIADRPGLAVGLIGGMLANTAGAGILGGIIAGFLAGYTVKFLNDTIRLPASLTSLKPILILPLLGSLIVGLLMVYVINPPVASLMTALTEWLKSMNDANAIILGLILGAMMCIDMGGPVNKAAYTFSVGMIASGVFTPIAAAMAGGMVPPIGMAIATWIAKNKFNENQRNAGKASFVLGLCFISEGALPFVAADPARVIISSVIGGALAGAISMGFGISLQAPHGGLFVIPFVSQPVVYLIAIGVGSVVTGVLYALLRQKSHELTPIKSTPKVV